MNLTMWDNKIGNALSSFKLDFKTVNIGSVQDIDSKVGMVKDIEKVYAQRMSQLINYFHVTRFLKKTIGSHLPIDIKAEDTLLWNAEFKHGPITGWHICDYAHRNSELLG